MATYLTVVPAYGRDYKTAKQVKEAWASGSDFLIQSINHNGGMYINKADKPEDVIMNVRYCNLTKVVVIR
jgi:hypothetical protein